MKTKIKYTEYKSYFQMRKVYKFTYPTVSYLGKIFMQKKVSNNV
jgi:hypothetical protein